MLRMLRLLIVQIACSLCSRRELLLEILALRRQLNVFKAGHSRPRLTAPDGVFWVVLRRFWPGWKRARLSLSNRRQSSLGIGLVSNCIGHGARGIRLAQAG